MEGPTYTGREWRGKRERDEVPPIITVPPGPRGARIVTVYVDQWSNSSTLRTAFSRLITSTCNTNWLKLHKLSAQ